MNDEYDHQVPPFKPITPQNLAQRIAGVQPISGPTGAIFGMKSHIHVFIDTIFKPDKLEQMRQLGCLHPERFIENCSDKWSQFEQDVEKFELSSNFRKDGKFRVTWKSTCCSPTYRYISASGVIEHIEV